MLSVQYENVHNRIDKYTTTSHVLQSKVVNVSNIIHISVTIKHVAWKKAVKLANIMLRFTKLSFTDCEITKKESKYDYLKSTVHGKNWRRYYATILFKLSAQKFNYVDAR